MKTSMVFKPQSQHEYRYMTEIAVYNVQWVTTSKKENLSRGSCVLHIVLWRCIFLSFLENISNGLVTEWTRFCDGWTKVQTIGKTIYIVQCISPPCNGETSLNSSNIRFGCKMSSKL